MIYVLDTNICDLFRAEQQAVVERVRLARRRGDSVRTTIVTVGESISGWLPFCRRAPNGSARASAYTQLYNVFDFYRRIECLTFTDGATAIFDQLRASKIRVGTNDLAIAAITLSVNGVLITRNIVDFQRVPNLIIEDWTK